MKSTINKTKTKYIDLPLPLNGSISYVVIRDDDSLFLNKQKILFKPT